MVDLKIPDINTIQIAGVLTSEPVFQQTPNGSSVATFTLETNRKYRDNAGILRENICHVNVAAWHKLADECQSLKKSNSVLIDGELQSHPQRGEDGLTGRSIVEIRVRRIQILNKQAVKKTETMQKPDKPEPQPEDKTTNETNRVKVPSTSFDFGYQNLKI